ncbi:MAG: energy-coupling factor transporter transmembrane component T [Clostridia bacterium]
MREFTFGQFYPADSIIHKLDARVKLLITIAYITSIFIVDGFFGFIYTVLFLCIAIALAKIPIRAVVKTIKPILFLVLFTAILNLFFYQNGEILWQWWFIKIYDKSIEFSIYMALRLILLVMGSSILTLTTQPVELTDGIESLLTPLKWVRFPVHELALIMSIALRFIPTLMDESDRIIRAQKARGADFESGNLLNKAKAMIPILIPLLVSSFRRADELADAMDARCYSGGKNRTKYKKFHIGMNDVIACMSTAAMIMIIITTNAVLL